ncbi:hypothetical protein CUMW_044190 [Citrus unshiu]|nr:hypothetical protein CUMW_044190 [Citrus unshiu]
MTYICLNKLFYLQDDLNSELKHLCREREVKAALEVMDKLKNIGIFLDSPDIIELLNVCMDLKLLEAGKRFENDGVRPNWSTFVGVITACGCFGAVDEGFQHFESVTRDYDINPTLEHFLGIVDLYGRLQKIAEAREFIRNMQIDASSVVWETLEKYAQTEPGLLLGEPSSSLRLSNKKKAICHTQSMCSMILTKKQKRSHRRVAVKD